jgi:hypothetical protein
VQLVAAFNEETRGHSGLLVAGREHFFDSRDELREALGLKVADEFVALDEFGEEDVKSFLAPYGVAGALPDWLPRRPLLLATLAARNLLASVLQTQADEPAEAWEALLTRVCEREAAIHRNTLDPGTIRHILEQLASDARRTATGLGPITETDIAEAFRHSVGAYPDEAARTASRAHSTRPSQRE